MRLVFLGSPPFGTAVLRALLGSPHEVAAVVTPPDRPRGRGRSVRASAVVELAREGEVPLIQPPTTKDPGFVAALAGHEPEVLVVASYGEILRTDVLDLAPHGSLNVHASLLPRWRGAAPIQRAILEGDAETGVSVQRMVLALDEGDVLIERRTEIAPTESSGALLERLAVLGGEAIVDALDHLEAGTATFTPQDESLATYAGKLTKADGVLDWNEPADALVRRVRAMTPWPGARTTLADGRELVVLEAYPVEDVFAKPGTISSDAKRLVVAAGEGALELARVKPAGKGAMDGGSFLRGARLEPGTRLGA